MAFRRMADRRPVETMVERDDGVVFAMRGGGGGADLVGRISTGGVVLPEQVAASGCTLAELTAAPRPARRDRAGRR